jgi:hypothetical protein
MKRNTHLHSHLISQCLTGGLVVAAGLLFGDLAIAQARTPMFADPTGIAADLAIFLEAIGIHRSLESVDLNKVDSEYVAGRRIDIPSPNGIPDAVELSLVQRVLDTPEINFTARSGIGGEHVRFVWNENLAAIRQALPHVGSAIHNAIAGYMTIGDLDSVHLMEAKVYDTWGVTLNTREFSSQAQQHLAWDGNADQDGMMNREEWQSARGDLEVYLQSVLNGNDKPVIFRQLGYMEEYNEECGYCDKTQVFVGARVLNSGISADACEVALWSGDKRIAPKPEGVPVAMGRNLEVAAWAPPESCLTFLRWEAEHNLLNGERNARAKFMLMGDHSTGKTVINAVFCWDVVRDPRFRDHLVVNPGTGVEFVDVRLPLPPEVWDALRILGFGGLEPRPPSGGFPPGPPRFTKLVRPYPGYTLTSAKTYPIP